MEIKGAEIINIYTILLGLSYSIYEKTFCEARVKPKMSSNFQMTFLRYTPPFETASERRWTLHWSMLSMRPHLKHSDEVHRFRHPDLPPKWPSPLVPQGEWPTWSKPGKWYKRAMQLFISIWHYLQWLFTNMYMHHLITYSCTKSIKMLWGLFLPLTNLLLSLHQQSHVLLHQGTTFIHLSFVEKTSVKQE